MMNSPESQQPWLITSIRLEWILGGVAIAIVTLASAFWVWRDNVNGNQAKLSQRVTDVERKNGEQENHFSRIEGAIAEQRTDTSDSLRNISQDINNLSNKVDGLKDQLISNSVGNRPDVQRWSKP